MAGIEHYEKSFAEFESALAGAGPEWLHAMRREGLATFRSLGFPGLRNERWRGTRVRPIAEREFQRAGGPTNGGFDANELRRRTFEDQECRRMVFVDGRYAPELSSVCDVPEGVILTSLQGAVEELPELVEPHLGKVVSTDDAPFVALNTAFLDDGAFVYLADNVVLGDPIHIAFVTTAAGVVTHPRILVVAGKNVEATLVESYVGTASEYFTNVVSEFVCGENTKVMHCKLQREHRTAFHVATQHANIGGNGTFETENVSFGGALVRNDINSVLGGEGIDCRVDGLYLGLERQHVDNHTFIRHAKPHCHSYELYKGILNDRARGVFNGKIYVDPDAQKTDAKQSNSCILLSDNARVNTQPQLEIFADDVKCTHGATVGYLDEEAVYYLRSRGIPHDEARNILVYAFAAEVLERVTVTSIRDRLEADLFGWLQQHYAQEG